MNAAPIFRYSHTIGFYSQTGRGFNNPVDAAFGRDGVLYVLNRAGPEVAVRLPYKRVSMCTVDEEYLGEFSSGGKQDGQLWWPASIDIDADGNVYVSDEALHRITVFSDDGQFLGKWGVRGEGDGEFIRPSGVAFDPDGYLLVVDGTNNRVQRYDKDGRFIGAWGRQGTGNGEFNLPWGITVDHDGNVYVADWRNDRIQKFDADGKHLSTWGESGQGNGEFHRPSGVEVDSEGMIYIADWGNERVQVLGPHGTFIAKFRGGIGTVQVGRRLLRTKQGRARGEGKGGPGARAGSIVRKFRQGGVGQHREAVLGADLDRCRCRGENIRSRERPLPHSSLSESTPDLCRRYPGRSELGVTSQWVLDELGCNGVEALL